MKKALLILILMVTVSQLRAQQLTPVNPVDTGLLKNPADGYLKWQLTPGLLQPQPGVNGTLIGINAKPAELIKEPFYSLMPVAVLKGNSKMPVIKLNGNSKMPVLKMASPDQTITVSRNP
jgi:hypothetical protein